jgi:hypothetical protein
MAVCAGIKRSGGRCTVSVGPGETYCHHHDPARQEERRRAASRAGRSKPNRELKDVKGLCVDLTERVLSGDLAPGPAAVANQLINTRLRAIEQERKIKETEDLEARIEALEQAQGQKGARPWGA